MSTDFPKLVHMKSWKKPWKVYSEINFYKNSCLQYLTSVFFYFCSCLFRVMVMWIYLGLSDWEESQTVGWKYAFVTTSFLLAKLPSLFIFSNLSLYLKGLAWLLIFRGCSKRSKLSWESSLKAMITLDSRGFYFWDLWQYLNNLSFLVCFWRTVCVIYYKNFPAFPSSEHTQWNKVET